MEYKSFLKQHILNFPFIEIFINSLLECNGYILYYFYCCVLKTKLSFLIPSLQKLRKRCNIAKIQSPPASKIYHGSFALCRVSAPLLYLPKQASFLLLKRAKMFPTSGLYMSARIYFLSSLFMADSPLLLRVSSLKEISLISVLAT